MRTPLTLAGFAMALAAILAASFGVGNAAGPIGRADTSQRRATRGSQLISPNPVTPEVGAAVSTRLAIYRAG